MENRWILICESYEGICKNAVNLLASTLSSQLKYVFPVKLASDVTEKE